MSVQRPRWMPDPLKYAKQYRVEEIRDEKGRTRTKLVYLGEWAQPEGKILPRLVASGGLAVVSCAALLLLQGLSHGSYHCWYVRVPQLLALFPGLYLLLGLMDLPWKGKPQPWDRYQRGILRCCRSGTAVGVLALLSLIPGEGLWWILSSGSVWSSGDTLHLLFVLLSGGCAVGVMLLLRSIDIRRLENEKVVQ